MAFLDEPTAGVDVAGRQVVREVVAELRGAGVCVLLATHELDEAERVADRVVIVDHGRVVADGDAGGAHAAGGRRRDPLRAPARPRRRRPGRAPWAPPVTETTARRVRRWPTAPRAGHGRQA